MSSISSILSQRLLIRRTSYSACLQVTALPALSSPFPFTRRLQRLTVLLQIRDSTFKQLKCLKQFRSGQVVSRSAGSVGAYSGGGIKSAAKNRMMTSGAQTEAPYGSWKSPLTPDLVSGLTLRSGSAAVDDSGRLLWLLDRPQEKGRTVVVRQSDQPGGPNTDVTPADVNVRTLVQEYGNGAWILHDNTVYYSNFVDQRVYALPMLAGASPVPITPACEGRKLRYAAGQVDSGRDRYVCVREDHRLEGKECVNEIVAFALKATDPDCSEAQVLVSGSDFYGYPVVSPDGRHLAWMEWSHPNMPWDRTRVCLGLFGPDGSIAKTICIAGGDPAIVEAAIQPQWSPAGELFCITDRHNGFWNLYRWDGDYDSLEAPGGAGLKAVFGVNKEFGGPMWVQRTDADYAFVPGTASPGWHIVASYVGEGSGKLGLLDVKKGTMAPINTHLTSFQAVFTGAGKVFVVGSSGTEFPCITEVELAPDLSGGSASNVRWIISDMDLGPYRPYLSPPESVEFPTKVPGQTAFANVYYPRNADFTAPQGTRPPLLVRSHGGPTSSASGQLSFPIQYWTSRGWAVADVNYGGSTGFGRAYRERLYGQWGIVDVDDCCSCAEFLAKEGLVDGARVTIDGSSAGGYTTLCALTFRDTFKAGASKYGIGDIATLALETHKFESRYLDQLIGPFESAKQLYHDRSPIHFTDKLSCPVILFQGLNDKVVPPSQAKAMYDAVKGKGLPVALVEYEGEEHGFRSKENIKHCLEQEYSFFARVLGGFTPADPIESVHIDNLD